jgi:hypothetical protein
MLSRTELKKKKNCLVTKKSSFSNTFTDIVKDENDGKEKVSQRSNQDL